MEVKGVSFSKYKAKINTYIFEKLSLFEFLFIQVILDTNLYKEKKIKDCLIELDIKEDLHYLFNNVYYKLIDNLIIEDTQSEDINELTIKDIKIDSRFVEYLNAGYFPILNENIEKEFVYDYLKNKVVLEKEIYTDSNVCLFKVDNSRENIEKIINNHKKSLLDIDNGLCILKDVVIDPYYFKVDVVEKSSEYMLSSLKENSLYLDSKEINGEFLSNNIYYTCLYGDEKMRDYSDVLFVYNKEKEFEVENNCIYVGYEFKGNNYIDLANKEAYTCGQYKLATEIISTYTKTKVDVSDFKLYLIKNKNKFKSNISKCIELF